MTEQSKKGKIEIYSSELKLTRINSSVEAHLIEDQKEEQQLKELMK